MNKPFLMQIAILYAFNVLTLGCSLFLISHLARRIVRLERSNANHIKHHMSTLRKTSKHRAAIEDIHRQLVFLDQGYEPSVDMQNAEPPEGE